jgi:low affinity Fe/Cu permease
MEKLFARFASATAKMAGSPVAFLICLVSVLIWAATGPAFHYSETWQLVINTGTTIVTFLMVFLIQNSQNRDGAAIQTKLDELIRASEAGDEFMGIEKMTDKELEGLHAQCAKAARDSHRRLAQAEAERKARQSRTAKTAPKTVRARRRPATAHGAS